MVGNQKKKFKVPDTLNPMRKKVKKRQIRINTNNQNDLSQIKESVNESMISSIDSSYLNVNPDSQDESVTDSEGTSRRSHKPDIFKSGGGTIH